MSLRELLKKKLKGLSSGNELNYLELLPTGIASLDAAIGGGLPLRRVVQIYGPESVGKSALALNIIRYIQQQDKEAEAFYVDCEATITKGDIDTLGIDGERLTFYNPHGGEDAYDSALEALQAGAKLAVIDSIPFLRPKKVLDEIDKDSQYRDVSSIALLMERVQAKIVHTLQNTNGVLLFINQQRPSKSMYEAPSFPGGSALKFMLSLNINITSSSKDKNDPALMTQKILIRKNKTFVPLMTAEVPYYNRLPQYGQCLLSAAKDVGLVNMKAGGHYSVSDELATELGLENPKLGHGAENAAKLLEEHKKAYKKLYDMVIAEACKAPPALEMEFEEAASIYDN